MADILIRCVRFPENCAQCFNAHDEYCYLLNRRLVTKDWVQRKDDCPLVELPEHGDLIDRDEAYAKWVKGQEDVLTNAPVIIPANIDIDLLINESPKGMQINLSRDDCENVAEFIEEEFFNHIYNLMRAGDLDNVGYVRSLIRAMDALYKAAGKEPSGLSYTPEVRDDDRA